MLQFDFDLQLAPILVLLFLLFLVILNTYLALKVGWVLVLFVSVFSITIGVYALNIELPMQPIIQSFFIIYQVILFTVKIFGVMND
ncbi:MAG: hypothetical protein ACFFHV_20280 [Promethearchaeota archaeon]